MYLLLLQRLTRYSYDTINENEFVNDITDIPPDTKNRKCFRHFRRDVRVTKNKKSRQRLLSSPKQCKSMLKTANCIRSACLRSRCITKTLLVMKLTVLFLTVGFLNVSATGVSQNVSFSGKNVSLEAVFSSLEKQTGFVFIYTDPVIKASKPVTINAESVPLEQFLSNIFKSQPLLFEIKNKNIIVSLKSSSSPQSSNGTFDLRSDTLGDVRGRVVDEKGEPLAGVNVVVKGTKIGTSTNANGEFFLGNVDDNAVLQISAVGFTTTEVNTNKSLSSISLKRSIVELDETVVIAYGTTTKRMLVGNVSTLKAEDIAKQPVNNPLLALQGRVPGLFITQVTGLPGRESNSTYTRTK